MEILYQSDDVQVRCVAAPDRSRWVVTFDNHSIGAGFDRPGFGEAYLQSVGISALHVLGRGNDWYQYPDMALAADAVRAATGDAAAVVTYGSSMGGYAALRFAPLMGATAALAMSPQYSIDPARVPWERRWAQDSGRIAWRAELAGPLGDGFTAILIYDPVGDDLRHAALIEAEIATVSVRLPHAGHPVTTFLGEVGLLHPIVLAALDGSFDARALFGEARRRRRESSVFLGTLAEQQPAWRQRTAIALGRKAVAAQPQALLGRLSLGRVLSAAGQHDEAVAVLRDLVAVSGRIDAYLVPYANALLAAGDAEAATEIAREVAAAQPDTGHLRHWHAWLLWQSGRYHEAIEEQHAAIACEPGNTLYRKTLNAYRRRARAVRQAAETPAEVPLAVIAGSRLDRWGRARRLLGRWWRR